MKRKEEANPESSFVGEMLLDIVNYFIKTIEKSIYKK